MRRPIGVIERTRIARKAAGVSSKVMATALGVSLERYRSFERTTALPDNLIDLFCVLARCDPSFLVHGAGAISPQVIHSREYHGIVAPQNLCGGPCVYRQFWCRPDCELARH